MSHDVIVAGAGSAGAVVATRLAERGRRVLLLEAGPDFPSDPPALLTTDLRIPVTEYDWGYESEGDRTIPVPRGRVVGGSSATNAVAAIRPQPADLEEWGAPEWSWDACLGALCRIEDDAEFGDAPWHGRGGPIRVERPDPERAAPVNRAIYEAMLAAGSPDAPDQNAPRAQGAGPQPYNVRDGVRQSTLVTYLAGARTLPGLELRAGTLVDRVLLERGRAAGVVLAGGETLRAGLVVVAGGAIGSPAILLRSGIGPAAHLGEHGIACAADLPVGENLHDHPANGVLARARDEGELDRNLLQRFMLRRSFAGRAGEEDAHVFGPFTSESVRTPFPRDTFVLAAFATKPRSRGWVRLRSADPADPPRIFLNYFEDPADLETMVRAFRTIYEVYAAPPLAKLVEEVTFPPPASTDSELAALIRATAVTDHHAAGTCALGSVVDARLRVHGIEALRVCDASVIPTPPRANTNFPTMMVAERFAELLAEEV